MKNYKGYILLNSKRSIIAIIIGLFLTIVSLFYMFFYDNDCKLAIVYSIILFTIICCFFVLNRNLVLFEPMVLFSAMYITVCFTTWYLVGTNFETNLFVNNTTYKQPFPELFNQSLLLFLIGYIMTLVAYYQIRKGVKKFEINYETKEKISNLALDILIVSFLFIGISNFIVNVHMFANNNLITYMTNLAVRKIEFSNGGTTIGYHFVYFAIYMWMFKIFREGKRLTLSLLLFSLIAIIIKASTGRIFSTLLFIAMLIGIYYFNEISRKKKVVNLKYLVIAILLVVFALSFYVFRAFSGLNYNNLADAGFYDTIKTISSKLFYYIFDRGNTPNIAIVPKIIDNWNSDIGFLYGKSLIGWILNILPSEFHLANSIPSVLVKDVLFSNINTGNMPPTCIGEFYANFGVPGVILGMYIFGILSGILYNFIQSYNNFWILLIYLNIVIGFISIFPKVEFNNFPIWNIMFYIYCYILMRALSIFIIFIKNGEKNVDITHF